MSLIGLPTLWKMYYNQLGGLDDAWYRYLSVYGDFAPLQGGLTPWAGFIEATQDRVEWQLPASCHAKEGDTQVPCAATAEQEDRWDS